MDKEIITVRVDRETKEDAQQELEKMNGKEVNTE